MATLQKYLALLLEGLRFYVSLDFVSQRSAAGTALSMHPGPDQQKAVRCLFV
jgi:hypothetical protein